MLEMNVKTNYQKRATNIQMVEFGWDPEVLVQIIDLIIINGVQTILHHVALAKMKVYGTHHHQVGVLIVQTEFQNKETVVNRG